MFVSLELADCQEVGCLSSVMVTVAGGNWISSDTESTGNTRISGDSGAADGFSAVVDDVALLALPDEGAVVEEGATRLSAEADKALDAFEMQLHTTVRELWAGGASSATAASKNL